MKLKHCISLWDVAAPYTIKQHEQQLPSCLLKVMLTSGLSLIMYRRVVLEFFDGLLPMLMSLWYFLMSKGLLEPFCTSLCRIQVCPWKRVRLFISWQVYANFRQLFIACHLKSFFSFIGHFYVHENILESATKLNCSKNYF